jgi:hypothetical protein
MSIETLYYRTRVFLFVLVLAPGWSLLLPNEAREMALVRVGALWAAAIGLILLVLGGLVYGLGLQIRAKARRDTMEAEIERLSGGQSHRRSDRRAP